MGLAAAEKLAPGGEPLVRPARAFTGERILQRSIGKEEIPSLVRRRLIGVSGAHAPILRHYSEGAARARSTTVVRISAPPTSCDGAMVSPRSAAASNTVHTGSTVDSTAARVGPTRSSPAKSIASVLPRGHARSVVVSTPEA